MTDLKAAFPTFYRTYRYFLGKYKKLTRKAPVYRISGQLPSQEELAIQAQEEAYIKRPYKVVVRLDERGTPVTTETRWDRSEEAMCEIERFVEGSNHQAPYTLMSAELWHNGLPCMELIQDQGQASGYRWVSTG